MGEDRFRLLAAAAPVGIFETTASGDCVYVNPRWCELTALSADDAAGRGWLRSVHPDDRERVATEWYAAASAGAEFALEYRFRSSSGREVWVAGRAAPQRDAEGNVIRYIGTVADITDRKRAEVALRASEERLRAIITSATDAVVTVDADQRIVVFNGAAEAMFRCPAAEAIGGRLDRFIPAESRGQHARHVAAFGDTGMGPRPMGRERVLTAVRADGERFPMEAQISQATVGGKKLYTVIIRDVTERKRAEAEREALLQREREARERAEAATALVERVQAIADAAISNLSVDDLLQELLDRVRTVLGTDTAVVLLREGDVLRVRAAIGIDQETQASVSVPIGRGFAGRIAAAGRPIVLDRVDYEAVTSDYMRQKGIRSLAGVPLEVAGRVIGVLHTGTFRPRHFTDDEVRVLQLARERIAVAIERAAAHDAERHAREAAEAASRAKDEFLSTISHELRTPLAAILGWVRLLRDGRLSGDRSRQALEIIERSGRSQARLIDDLLDVSRIVRGRLRVDLRPVDLTRTVESAADAVRAMAEQKGVVLRTRLEAASARVFGDPERLQQVVWNLVSNAVKFTPAGGRIDVDLTRIGNQARLVVRDTGKGIEPGFLPHVFEAFRQADSVRGRQERGLGLGLSIAQQLVHLHGGAITVESEGADRGATFTVVLPLALEEVSSSATPAGPDDVPFTLPRLEGVRVLIVDDDAATRELLRAILEPHGASVTTATSIEQARALLSSASPHVLVSDIRFPDADGYALVRELRRSRPLAHLPAVAITAYPEEDERRTRAAGFDRRFEKPIAPDILVSAIGELAVRDGVRP
jgi:PAS domain S-box-containing protein